jgi:hypothetical protein
LVWGDIISRSYGMWELKRIIRPISQAAFGNLDDNADNNRVVKYSKENVNICFEGSKSRINHD